MSDPRATSGGVFELDEELVRRGAAGMGLASVAIGGLMALTPRLSVRLIGARHDEPMAEILSRAVGARDIVIGLALWLTATGGGQYAPWLLARAASDAGDATALTLTMALGDRRPRLAVGLVVALVAAGASLGMYRVARSLESRPL